MFSNERRWAVAAARINVPVDDYLAALNRGEKICGGCLRSLPRDSHHFGTEGKAFDGLRSRCIECVANGKRAEYVSNPDKHRVKRQKYQEANRPKLYAYNAAWQRRFFKELRGAMIAAYGGACACCGESEPIFLDLDHIHNDGKSDRAVRGNGRRLMVWLKANGWPKDRHQLLCCNCNQGKARNGGVCPHKTREASNAA